jgi:hypothetical protein
MQLDKSAVLDFLRSQGAQGKAEQADAQLPDKVDTDAHAEILRKLGIDPQQLIEKFVAGKGASVVGRLFE